MFYNNLSKKWLTFSILTVFSSYLIWKNMDLQYPISGDKKLYLQRESIDQTCEDPIFESDQTCEDLISEVKTNISEDFNIDIVNFNPIEGEGAMGIGVITPPEELSKMNKLFKIHNFNLLASDRIPLNRTLPDMRVDSCRLKKYPKDLPNTSVIIIFHNEAWSVLLRTIWSVVIRTPSHLLREIILVDDASEREFLKDDLDQHIKRIPSSIKIIRLSERNGIVRARLAGVNIARGEILTFLDAHCECSEGWVEPLLARIKENRNTIICPTIDSLAKADFSYVRDDQLVYFMFNWHLGLKVSISHENFWGNSPIKTPIIAGGLFSIDRNYFFEMGSYDEEMKIWGGENMEISFRIWQCGGQLEIHPCSHVAHLERVHPYTHPGGYPVIRSNLERAALVWMDEWSEFFFLYNSLNIECFYNRNLINVTDRLNLRKRLRCKPFSWYLKNIWPDNFFPADNRFFGKIVWLNATTNIVRKYDKLLCKMLSTFVPKEWSDIILKIWQNADILVDSINYTENHCLQPHLNVSVCDHCEFAGIGPCLSDKTLQDNFVITERGIIMTNENNCLNFQYLWRNESVFNVLLNDCVYKTSWQYDFNTQKIYIKNTDLCLTIERGLVTTTNIMESINYTGKNLIVLKKCCPKHDLYQKWALIPLPWKSFGKK